MLCCSSKIKTPYTRYNPLYNRLYKRLYNQENVCIHDAAGCTTGCTAGCTTGCIVYTQLNALIDNNIQALSKFILIQLGIHFPLTMKCASGLIVGGALQMLLLLLHILYCGKFIQDVAY